MCHNRRDELIVSFDSRALDRRQSFGSDFRRLEDMAMAINIRNVKCVPASFEPTSPSPIVKGVTGMRKSFSEWQE